MVTNRTLGVIGAGVMGIGVAQNLAQTGHQVILIDRSDAILARAKAEIKNNIRLYMMFNKDKEPQNVHDINDRIICTTEYAQLEKVDFLIENVTEQWEIKQNVYAQLDTCCSEACIFAANTSALSITRIGSITSRPERVIGIHFMNPVPLKSTVELIRGYHTSEETLASAQQLLERMGKDWIIVNDMPGFVTNRVLMLTINEAAFLVQDRVASVEDIDKVFKSCFGHKMGPLETADLIGLDTILYSIDVLYESYKDSKYRPCPLLRKMVDAGLFGCKSGQGFYRYSHGLPERNATWNE